MRQLPTTVKVAKALDDFNNEYKSTHLCRIGKRYCKDNDGLCDPVPGSFVDECGINGCKKFG
jgi:hypothetical protein